MLKNKRNKTLRVRLLSAMLLIAVQTGHLFAQQPSTVTGKITDSNSEDLIGVTVVLKEQPAIGTVTDNMGNYLLKGVPMNSTLVFSYVGMSRQEVKFTGQKTINISLSDDKALDEVVVVGYSTQKKVNLTGAISTVDEKAFLEKPVVSATQSLQGVVPGLVIQQNSSEPGSSPNINIRGIGSLQSGTYPLILIDGLVGDINTVNPADIATVSVLKDAASTSIYGSRAANGVILITTKKGREGKANIAYDYSYGLQSPTTLPKYASAFEYGQMKNEALVNSNMPAQYSPADLDRFREMGKGTVWIDEIYQSYAPQSNHSISINGANEKTSYLVSGAYMDQRSMFEGNDDFGSKRYNGRINIDSKLTSKLRIKASTAYTGTNTIEHAYWTDWLIEQCTRMPVIYSIKDQNGFFTLPSGSNSNSLARLTLGGTRESQNDNFTGNVDLEWELIKDLKINASFGANLSTNNMHQFRKAIDYAPYSGGGDTQNSVTDAFGRSLLLNQTLTANYSKKIGIHHFNFLAGTSQEGNKNRWFQVEKDGIPGNEFGELNNGELTNESNTYGSRDEWAISSFFGRVNYSLKDRYLLEANFRTDGSSRFAKDKRWSFFPSFSAGWRMSEEDFMSSFKETVSNLKLRASWGQVGNQDIGLYQYQRTVTVAPNTYSFYDNPVNGAYFSEVNKDISWEVSSIFDVGVDAAILNNKLSGTFDFYIKDTKDALVNSLPVPGIYGGGSPTQNVGGIRNIGWEFSLNYLFETGKVSHSVTVNLSDNVNEVTDDGGRALIGGSDVQTMLKKGYPINSYYALKSDGIYQNEAEVAAGPKQTFNSSGAKPGDLRYVDRDGSGTITENDRYILGNPFPRYLYGVTYALNWKGFDASFFIQGVGKRSVWIRGEGVEAFHNGNEGPVMDFHLDRWTPNNPNASYPRLTYGSESANNAAKSDFWIEDAAYARLKNFTLGYTLPSDLTKRWGMSRVKTYVSGQNLLTFTNMRAGYDPEVYSGSASSGRVYPVAKVIAVGLSVNF